MDSVKGAAFGVCVTGRRDGRTEEEEGGADTELKAKTPHVNVGKKYLTLCSLTQNTTTFKHLFSFIGFVL